MSWSNDSEPKSMFNWSLFAASAVVGFFAGWVKKLVFGLFAAKKK